MSRKGTSAMTRLVLLARHEADHPILGGGEAHDGRFECGREQDEDCLQAGSRPIVMATLDR